MTSVFLSHSSQDRPFAHRLARHLEDHGIRVWIDQAEMLVGDSLIAKIEAGIQETEYLAVILSPHSVQSDWVRKEVEIAMGQEIHGRRVRVLPILYKDCDIPGFLATKRWADLRARKYKTGVSELLARLKSNAIGPEASPGGSQKGPIQRPPRRSEDARPEAEVREALRKIRSEHPRVRQDGVDALVAHRSDSPLLDHLGHRDRFVRSAAAQALARLKNSRALTYLVDGLAETGRGHNLVIPDVENWFGYYGRPAFDILLNRIPEHLGYGGGERRWAQAIANAVDKNTVVVLLARARQTRREVFLKAAMQSGLKLRKADLSRAIASFVEAAFHTREGQADVSQWLATSPTSMAKWSQHLVRKWLEIDCQQHTSDAHYRWQTERLARTALSMGAVSEEDLRRLAQAISNRKLRETLEKVATERSKNPATENA